MESYIVFIRSKDCVGKLAADFILIFMDIPGVGGVEHYL